jgi:hypothetical protein
VRVEEPKRLLEQLVRTAPCGIPPLYLVQLVPCLEPLGMKESFVIQPLERTVELELFPRRLALKEQIAQLAQPEYLLFPSVRREPSLFEPLAPMVHLVQPEHLLEPAVIQPMAHSQWLELLEKKETLVTQPLGKPHLHLVPCVRK